MVVKIEMEVVQVVNWATWVELSGVEFYIQ